MHQDRFTNLSISHVERDLTKSIESKIILNEFGKSSRMSILK